jgi:hypothetical protein
MSKIKNICVGYNKPSATGASGVVMFSVIKDTLKCQSKACLYEDGKWYCKRHAPSKKIERENKSWDNYISKLQ